MHLDPVRSLTAGNWIEQMADFPSDQLRHSSVSLEIYDKITFEVLQIGQIVYA